MFLFLSMPKNGPYYLYLSFCMGLESSTSFPRLTACYFILQASRGIQTIKNNISALIIGSVIEMSLTFLSSPL